MSTPTPHYETGTPAPPVGLAPPGARFDVQRVRADFPALHQDIRGRPLVYLDSAATAHKPQAVIDALVRQLTLDNGNVHRGAHALSERATEAFEGAREKVRAFVNAADLREIVFVRGTTEAINLVAQSWGRRHIGPGDEVIITAMEHHSNIVPWQMLCAEKRARLTVAPIDARGDLNLSQLERLLSPRTRLLAVTHVSNALGTVNPLEPIIELAHSRGVKVLVDGAQGAPHLSVDVRALGCDFYAFSGHKLYGPTGIGVLYGQRWVLEEMPPWQGGGEMILSVRFDRTLYNELPWKFEAGTPDIAGAVGLGAAIDYLRQLDRPAVAEHEERVLGRAVDSLSRLRGVTLVGTPRRRAAVVSFQVEGVHPHDLGTLLDAEGVALRTGHHCAQPLMDRFGVAATTRASVGLYTTEAEIDALVAGVARAREVFT